MNRERVGESFGVVVPEVMYSGVVGLLVFLCYGLKKIDTNFQVMIDKFSAYCVCEKIVRPGTK